MVVRDPAVGAELLGSIQDVPVAHASRPRLHRQRVGAGVRLGEAEPSEDQLVRIGELRQPSLFLLFGSAGADARDGQSHRLYADADAGAAPAELLVEDELGQEVQALAAIFLREETGGAQAELVRLLDDLVRKLLGLVVVGGHRPHLPLGKLVRELADGVLLLGQ